MNFRTNIGSNHTVEVKQATDDLRKKFAKLSDKVFKQATINSINFALTQSTRKLSESVRKIFNIDDATFKKAIKFKRATSNNQYGYVMARSKALNLSNFTNAAQLKGGVKTSFIGDRKGKKRGAWGSSPSPANTQGIFLEIYNGQQEHIPSAFLIAAKAKSSTGNLEATGNMYIAARGRRTSGTFVFMKERTPIAAMTSKSIYTTLINPQVQQILAPPITDVYSKKLIRELNKAVKQIK